MDTKTPAPTPEEIEALRVLAKLSDKGDRRLERCGYDRCYISGTMFRCIVCGHPQCIDGIESRALHPCAQCGSEEEPD